MKLIVMAITCMVLSGCPVPGQQMTPEAIAKKVKVCRNNGLVPVEMVNLSGYVFDIQCRIPKEPVNDH